MCCAEGCRLPGSIKHGNSYVCRYHFGAAYQVWPKITEIVNDHFPLIRLIQRIKGECLRLAELHQRLQVAMETRYPELCPLENELPGQWMTRAEKYVSGKVKHVAIQTKDMPLRRDHDNHWSPLHKNLASLQVPF